MQDRFYSSKMLLMQFYPKTKHVTAVQIFSRQLPLLIAMQTHSDQPSRHPWMQSAAASHVRYDLASPKPQLSSMHAVVKQIRHSQGTTEELRFFSLLQSLWALKHSTKRVLHWVSSWWERKAKTRRSENMILGARESPGIKIKHEK